MDCDGDGDGDAADDDDDDVDDDDDDFQEGWNLQSPEFSQAGQEVSHLQWGRLGTVGWNTIWSHLFSALSPHKVGPQAIIWSINPVNIIQLQCEAPQL